MAGVTMLYHNDDSIDMLPLSTRIRNALKRAGVMTIGQFIGCSGERFGTMRNVGKRSADELTSLKEYLILHNMELPMIPGGDVEEDPPVTGLITPAETGPWLPEMRQLLFRQEAMPPDIYRQVFALHEAQPELQGESLIYAVYELPQVALALKKSILHILGSAGEPLSPDSISAKLPRHLDNTTIVRGTLIALENEGSITERGGLYERKYPSVFDFANSISNETWRTLLLQRLQGITLEEAGRRAGLTRERVRQITANILRRPHRVAEDKYLYLFKTYSISREDFKLAFGEPDSTYNYLDMAVPRRGRRKLREVLDDPAVPLTMKRAAEKVIYKDYVLVDGLRMHKDRDTFLRYALRHYCAEPISYADFSALYQNMLDELGLGGDAKFTLNSRNYVTRLSNSELTLWHPGSTFRYYNTRERDCGPLLEELQLQQYEGLEFSTLKLFRDFPDLMKQYDIRDEYELHNLLKKVIPADFTPRITFHRMPTIEIGTADRDWQVMELLLEYGEITAQKLGEKYEELYGVSTATAISNQFKPISQYYANGVYSINFEPLTAEQKETLQATLTGELYSLDKIRSVFRQHYPGLPADRINAYTLKSLGFKPYSGYVLRDTYSSAVEYFDHILLDKDVVDLQQLDPFLLRLTSFSSELNRLRSSLEIIEFSPRQYVNIRRLRQAGYDKKDLEDYCLTVCRFVEPGSYFTIHSLHRDGFAHPLEDLGFDDWFYGSLLSSYQGLFSYRRFASANLFFYGKMTVTLEEFITDLLSRCQSIDIYDLQSTMHDDYGLDVDRYKIMDAIRNSDLYYDAIMEKVYIDYNTYFEEV